MKFTKIGVRTLFSLALCAAMASQTAAQINTHSIKFGYGVPEEHPLGQGVNKFIELVSQKSGGKIKIRPYPNSVLGGDMQMVSALEGAFKPNNRTIRARA